MLENQLLLFFIYLICGIIMCILLDLFRSTRRVIKTNNIVTYIEDLIYWIIIGLFNIFIIFKFNYGELRIYIPIAIITGIALYYFTISKYIISFSVSVLSFFKKVVNYFFVKIGDPVYIFIINLKKLVKNRKKWKK